MAKQDKKLALKIIIEAAKEYKNKLSNPTNKVIAIFKKQYDEKYYMDCTYLSKGQDIQELLSQDIIKEKIFCNLAENSEE